MLLITAVVFALLSLPTLADQARRTPGNITRLLDHFGDPPEEAIGFINGFELLLQHLNVFRAISTMFTGTGGFVDLGQLDGATWIPGGLVLSMWIAAAAATRGLAARTDVKALLHLHVVTGAALLLSWVSMSRIFGTQLSNSTAPLTTWRWTSACTSLRAANKRVAAAAAIHLASTSAPGIHVAPLSWPRSTKPPVPVNIVPAARNTLRCCSSKSKP